MPAFVLEYRSHKLGVFLLPFCEDAGQHGEGSSVAERAPVERDVAGSNPVPRPKSSSNYRSLRLSFCGIGACS